MRLRILVGALAILGAGHGTAVAAQPPHLGTPEVITSVKGEANITAASSTAGHPDAYAVFYRKIGANVYRVIHRDSRGHAHHFDIPTTSGSFPQAIRIVPLEAGGGMAIWDENSSRRVLARSWKPDGSVGPIQAVLSQVTTVRSADFESALWRVRADGRGTVVVATTGASPLNLAGVFASVRDPGGTFGAQQELTPPGEAGGSQRQLAVSPIVADGTVAVAWGPEDGNGPGGRAVRAGRSARFGPPAGQPFSAELGLTRANRSILADDFTQTTVSASLARRCPCLRPQVFRWPGGVKVLAFQRTNGDWHVATPGAQGVFGKSIRATENEGSLPVRRARPGELGFARFDTNTDNNLFRQRSRLVVVPFGARVPRSRRAPVLGFGSSARAARGRLLVPVFCDRVCGIHGSSGRAGRLPITDFLARRVDAALEPFSVAYLRIALPRGRAKVRVSLSASDDAGHRAVKRATFVRSSRAGFWCRSGTKGCRAG